MTNEKICFWHIILEIIATRVSEDCSTSIVSVNSALSFGGRGKDKRDSAEGWQWRCRSTECKQSEIMTLSQEEVTSHLGPDRGGRADLVEKCFSKHDALSGSVRVQLGLDPTQRRLGAQVKHCCCNPRTKYKTGFFPPIPLWILWITMQVI